MGAGGGCSDEGKRRSEPRYIWARIHWVRTYFGHACGSRLDVQNWSSIQQVSTFGHIFGPGYFEYAAYSGHACAAHGLTSRIGVPSSRSAPPRRSVPPCTLMSFATERPIGLGRWGVRVAKSPMEPPSKPGG
eukprot:scaffold24522_cov56-Isochrysis_galbana.AAC.1